VFSVPVLPVIARHFYALMNLEDLRRYYEATMKPAGE
jgi:hypothetical protein